MDCARGKKNVYKNTADDNAADDKATREHPLRRPFSVRGVAAAAAAVAAAAAASVTRLREQRRAVRFLQPRESYTDRRRRVARDADTRPFVNPTTFSCLKKHIIRYRSPWPFHRSRERLFRKHFGVSNDFCYSFAAPDSGRFRGTYPSQEVPASLHRLDRLPGRRHSYFRARHVRTDASAAGSRTIAQRRRPPAGKRSRSFRHVKVHV